MLFEENDVSYINSCERVLKWHSRKLAVHSRNVSRLLADLRLLRSFHEKSERSKKKNSPEVQMKKKKKVAMHGDQLLFSPLPSTPDEEPTVKPMPLPPLPPTPEASFINALFDPEPSSSLFNDDPKSPSLFNRDPKPLKTRTKKPLPRPPSYAGYEYAYSFEEGWIRC